GRTRTDELDGWRIDAGAQLFGSMFTRVMELARDLGLGGDLVRSSGRDALWRGGRAHEVVYGSVTSMLASGGLPLRTKVRLGTTYVPFLSRHADVLGMAAPDRAAAAGLDRRSIAEWGEREMGPEFVDYLVYPQLASYYGSLPEETSEGLYHVLAHEGMNVGLYALRGGIGRLCDAMLERVRAGGGDARLGTAVRGVEPSSDGVRIALGGDQEEAFDAAVVAVPAPVARELLGEAVPLLTDRLAAVRSRAALTVALLLDRPVGVRFFGLSFPRAESRWVAAACVEENKGAGLVPAGKGLVVAFIRPDVAPDLVEADSRRIVDGILPELRSAFPGLEGTISRARVYRWHEGHPIFYPGYLRLSGELRCGAGEGELPIALAGDYQHSSSVEGAVVSAMAAADRLHARLTSAGAGA
ncbi:MAG TPA: FAD-dependent oxidoreductase, partial [Longimicrobiaceae bacterium]|nr:FAD-dependent oxidoreductase [Longimicrobiaceae bacterium]